MKILLTVLLLLLFLPAISQTEYKPVRTIGEIPAEFLTRGKDVYSKDFERIKKSKKRGKKKRLEAEFYLELDFMVNWLFKNGYILYGDDISNYINELGAKIVSNLPDIDKDVKFFVVQDASVNAFATQNGYIFVNMGLISQCENEAQLAFVLAHELIHTYKNHGIKSYAEKKKLKKSKSSFRQYNLNKYVEYSQENEFEADILAFTDIYLKMGYDVNEAVKVFDVMLYSYLPFDEVPFNTDYFDDEYFKLPAIVKAVGEMQITAIEDFDDSKSLHPNIKKRRERIIEEISGMDIKETNKKYILPEHKFKKIQKITRYETCQLYLNDLDYSKAFYSAWLLSKDDPDNLYLAKIQAYALYGYSKIKNRYYKSKAGEDEKSYLNYESFRNIARGIFLDYLDSAEGKYSQVNYMIKNLNSKQLNIVALRQIFRALEMSPDDEYLLLLAKSSISDLVKIHEMMLSDFNTDTANIAEAENTKVLTGEEYGKLSKYEKIKYDKDHGKSADSFIKNAFLSFFSANESLKKLYSDIQNHVLDEPDNKYLTKGNADNLVFKKDHEKVNKVVMVNPVFVLQKHSLTDRIDSEKKEIEMIKVMRSMAKRQGIRTEFLDAYEMDGNMGDKFNDMAVLIKFFNENLLLNNFMTDNEYISSNLNYALPMKDTYNTDYFAISGIRRNMQVLNTGKIVSALFVYAIGNILIFPALIPYTVFFITGANAKTEYEFYIIDLSEEKYILGYKSKDEYKNFKTIEKSVIYDSYWLINNK